MTITKTDVQVIGGVLVFVCLLLWGIYTLTERACEEQIVLAKSSTDTLIVYGQRPLPNGPTCRTVLD